MTASDTLIRQLLTKYSLISDQVTKAEVQVILEHLAAVVQNNIPGAIVEFGCFAGTTSLFVQRWLQASKQTREYHVYDSFAGLPQKTAADASPAGFAFTAGELLATKSQFIQNFKRANVPLPIVHKGWFEDIPAQAVPPHIALAFLDGDYYSSIWSSLALIGRNMSSGGVIIIDDYLSSTLPGAKKAADAWLLKTGRTCTVREGMAIIRV